jgi:hypothetical protein
MWVATLLSFEEAVVLSPFTSARKMIDVRMYPKVLLIRSCYLGTVAL